MQLTTSKQLFDYWNTLRGDRQAPRRFEIEPGQIAHLLPETYIAECKGPGEFCFRLAGTRICDNFGSDLKGYNILGFWTDGEAEAIQNVLHCVVNDGGVGVVQFRGSTDEKAELEFEMLALPITHSGQDINRLLGNISAKNTSQWLGYSPITDMTLIDTKLIWPDQHQGFLSEEAPAPLASLGDGFKRIVRSNRRCFRVYDGGKS